MSTTHVYFADPPLAAARQEGQFVSDALGDGDAIRGCRSVSPNCSKSPIPRYERNMGFFRQLSRRFGLRSNDDLVFSSSNEDDNQSSSTDSCSSHAPAAAAIAPLLSGENSKKSSDYTSCASSETSSTVDITEQIQRVQLQLQQQQQNVDYADSNDCANNSDDAAADNNENSDDAIKRVCIQERKSVTRSSFSRQHRRSISSFRRAFEAFSISSRSLSCSGATPPPVLPNSPSSPSPTGTHNGTPIKTSLKSSSNLELNKNSQSSFVRKFSICSVSTAAASPSSSVSATTQQKSKTKPPPQRILRQPVSYTYLKGISGLPTQRVPRNSVCCQYARR